MTAVEAVVSLEVVQVDVSKAARELALNSAVASERERAVIDVPRYGWVAEDATYLKVRCGGRTVSIAGMIAARVNTDGRREVLAWRSAPWRPSRSGCPSAAW